jgi:hypothetical protein
MNQTQATENPSPEAETVHEAHGEHFHHFEESGLEEGNRPVPRWYVLALLVLGVTFVVYVISNFTGVQPNSAR